MFSLHYSSRVNKYLNSLVIPFIYKMRVLARNRLQQYLIAKLIYMFKTVLKCKTKIFYLTIM